VTRVRRLAFGLAGTPSQAWAHHGAEDLSTGRTLVMTLGIAAVVFVVVLVLVGVIARLSRRRPPV
jgi:hypothetical protein